jgi:hypothetical protein
MESGDLVTRAAGQWAVTIASTWWLPGRTSIAAEVTPRARALVTTARISAEPMPWCCQASATTTPMSVTPGQGRSTAIACPTMTPSRTATTASARPQAPDSRRTMAAPGTTGAKNRR